MRIFCKIDCPSGRNQTIFRNINLIVLIIIAIGSQGCNQAIHSMLPKNYSLLLDGKYAELEEYLETKEIQDGLTDFELLTLCGMYAQTKKYNKLFECLDRSPHEGRTKMGLPLKVWAYIELGQYMKVISEIEPYPVSGIDNSKADQNNFALRCNLLSALGVAYALNGNDEKALEVAKFINTLEQPNLNLNRKIFNFNQKDIDKIKRDVERNSRTISLAKIYVALERYQDVARITSEEVDDFWDRFFVGPLMDEINLSYNFIKYKTLYETGKFEEAKRGFDKLLKSKITGYHGAIYWQILADLGMIAFKEGNVSKSIDFLTRAVKMIEEQRSTIDTEAGKIGFVGNKQEVYQSLIATLFHENRYVEAFEYAERAKARALVDMLASKKRFLGRERTSSTQTAAFLKDLDKAEKKNVVQDYRISSQQRANTRSIIVQMKNKIIRANPELASLVSVTSLEVTEIQQLLPSDETLVEYFGSGDNLFAFIVDHGRVVGTKLDVKGLRQDIELFRYLIMDSDSNRFKEYGQVLFNKIIQPIKGMIGSKNLTIVPHGALHYLPFNALNSGGEYLIDRYNIRVLPSASVMQFLKDRREGHAGNLLVFGNPDLGDPNYDLPGAQSETIAITKDQPKSKLLLRKQATETAIKRFGEQFRYIHFATHGTFDAEKPLSSGLLLSGDDENDGTLTVGELYDLHLPADLVTLSACETALGKVANGDDVVGFTRGFLYAGTSSIVSSLWKVDDKATSILMQQFYKSLKESDKRSALRTAQLKVKDTYNSHPYFWAAFQITGSVQ